MVDQALHVMSGVPVFKPMFIMKTSIFMHQVTLNPDPPMLSVRIESAPFLTDTDGGINCWKSRKPADAATSSVGKSSSNWNLWIQAVVSLFQLNPLSHQTIRSPSTLLVSSQKLVGKQDLNVLETCDINELTQFSWWFYILFRFI